MDPASEYGGSEYKCIVSLLTPSKNLQKFFFLFTSVLPIVLLFLG